MQKLKKIIKPTVVVTGPLKIFCIDDGDENKKNLATIHFLIGLHLRLSRN